MKITAFILLIFCLHVSATSIAQTVTLNERNAPLEKVINDIKTQTGYSFFYNQDWMQNAQPVDITVKNEPLDKVLKACFSNQPFSYAVINKTIVLKLKEKPTIPNDQQQNASSVPLATITGKVTDSVGTPLIGATIAIKGTKTAVITDDKGEFQIRANQGDVLIISFIGFKEQQIPVTGDANNVVIQLKPTISGLNEVVISNGYQKISAERATGAYDQIDNKQLNRSVGANIIDRLAGITSGVQTLFGSGTAAPTAIIGSSPNTSTGLLVRGVATISSNVSTSPLVILDNFPYVGNINNINPNDIESVTVLKDAAAASIWGAQAGNGVIVITSKQGKFRQKMQVDFTANATILSKPNLFKNPDYISSSDYINIETYLYNQGYYTATLSNTTSYPSYTPIVGILAQQSAGTLSATDAANQINAFRSLDNRSDQEKYFYQTGVNQQYSLGISGGSTDMSYRVSGGWDNNKATSVGNTFGRKTLDAFATYLPIKGLEIVTRIKYTQYQSNQVSGINPGPIYEMLADAGGNALPITYPAGHSTSFVNTLMKEGYLDWNFYPLNELHNTSDVYNNKELLFNITAKYKVTNFLNIEAQYQNEYQNGERDKLENQQSFDVTNRINTYSLYNSVTGAITYNYPLGGLYSQYLANYNTNNYRLDANLNKTVGDHQITGLVGAEIRQIVGKATNAQYDGYDPQFGTYINNLDFITVFQTTPNSRGRLPSLQSAIAGSQYRYVDYVANIGDSYKDRYTLSVNARKDGSNIFGVNTNARFNLLWSVGGGWNINKEAFYHLDWLPDLKMRVSYGFSGNVYNGSGYTVGGYQTSGLINTPYIYGLTAPNPNLTWETVRNINLGLDFGLKSRTLYGSIDVYRKDGLNLIEPITIAQVTGFSSYTGNAANTKGKGLELNLKSDLLRGHFKWTANLIANFNTAIITNYSVPPNYTFLYNLQPGIVGKPVYAMYSYKWAGLDPANGNPRGYLNGQPSENYSGIINNFKPDSLVYNGSALPTAFGSLINNFNYKKFTLSVMLGYEAGFYFRKPSTTGNYVDLLNNNGLAGNRDYAKAWQKPGDEATTNVPSFIYPSDSQRAQFYQYSQVLVQNGANIRLNDARLDYDLSDLVKHSGFSQLRVFSYAHIYKLLWTANKDHLDPDVQGQWVPNPFTLAFGLTATLK